ncbi:MAG TPA: hypothetical protein VF757_10435 [Sphingomicrobium sp.]
MIGLLFLLMARPVVPETRAHALQLCRPRLERSAGGQIQTIDVNSERSTRTGLVISGRLTAFIGMGTPATGAASTHHLIRAQFDYICEVRSGRVVSASAKPLE